MNQLIPSPSLHSSDQAEAVAEPGAGRMKTGARPSTAAKVKDRSDMLELKWLRRLFASFKGVGLGLCISCAKCLCWSDVIGRTPAGTFVCPAVRKPARLSGPLPANPPARPPCPPALLALCPPLRRPPPTPSAAPPAAHPPAGQRHPTNQTLHVFLLPRMCHRNVTLVTLVEAKTCVATSNLFTGSTPSVHLFTSQHPRTISEAVSPE